MEADLTDGVSSHKNLTRLKLVIPVAVTLQGKTSSFLITAHINCVNMVKSILCITVLIAYAYASTQQCGLKAPLRLTAKYHSSFNETYIAENSYLTQMMVTGIVSAQCIADCVQRRTCLAAEWRQSDMFYCRRLYSNRTVEIASVIEPDDKSTVTYIPLFSVEGNIIITVLYDFQG